ncbi:NF038122 family metalloprotease [Oscillatoriales cyanobacterium LEGE 11467]|uniref:NF038122 family metalloprotease n=1 Tax=Zarconia navalis LEGE 11467 TaxID=1828826 RepID=A0A928ZA16_9CYAN|nr:NF038122 family metalloprotease [Zarconia navalis]MBE9041306.1 NF038122 family metalloprotease [Zarconia navalis LEGE 11467]
MGEATPAQAASFNFTYAPGTTMDQILGFETAANVWSQFLVDDVEVNLFVEVVDSNLLPDYVIGGTMPGLQSNSYSQFQNALYNDRTSNDDFQAYANLDTTGLGGEYGGYLETNTWSNDTLTLTTANAKALDLRPSDDSAIDGYILMSDLSQYSVNWDYNTRRHLPTPQNSLDYASVALHEIGHALGFISGIDSAVVTEAQATMQENFDRLARTNSLDMFRYSNRSYQSAQLDLGVGADSYFSIDSGTTPLAYFSTGTQDFGLGSDGFQGSHWKQQSSTLGIMDPLLSVEQRRHLKDFDARSLDIIGWDLPSYLHDGIASWELQLIWYDLTYQAEARLANTLGLTPWQFSVANPDVLAQSLTSWVDTDNDGVDDRVEQMLEDSQVYNWCWSNCSGNSGGSWQSGLWQEFRWQTLSTDDLQANAQAVPEPTSTTGLLSLGLLAIGSQLKRRRQSNG